jgi:hypothetical protein
MVEDLFKGSDPAVRTSTIAGPEMGDLIPPALCIEATRLNLQELGAGDALLAALTEDALNAHLNTGVGTWDALSVLVNEVSNAEWHIEKVGFARGVTAALHGSTVSDTTLETYASNMAKLFRRLGSMTRAATRELAVVTLSQRIDRAKNSFIKDNPVRAKRERALVLLEELEGVLDDSREGDVTKVSLQELRRDFDLENDVTKDVDDYETFLARLEHIKYVPRIVSQSKDVGT